MHPGWAWQLNCVTWFEHGYPVPVHEPMVVAFHVQPERDSHVACANFEVHATAVPLHEPMVVAFHVQPGVAGHETPLRARQLVVVGVPMQRGPVVNVSVGVGVRMSADLQQI